MRVQGGRDSVQGRDKEQKCVFWRDRRAVGADEEREASAVNSVDHGAGEGKIVRRVADGSVEMGIGEVSKKATRYC